MNKILYIDDEPVNLETFKRVFGSEYRVQTALSAKEALELLKNDDFPLVIADQRMPGMTGIELCEKLYATRPQTIRMILTAFTETKFLLDAINQGHVHDYIVKPWKKEELKKTIDRAFEDYHVKMKKIRELEIHAAQLKEEVQKIYESEAIIGKSGGLRPILDTLHKAAPTDSTILITGETGTGKELMARAVHDLSKRKAGPFVPVHCAAMVKTLMESELFGHEKGSFTGADRMRVGRFEMASGGTIFLDEVGEIPEDIQVKLLRILQEREIQRVGGDKTIPVDVRVVAATHRDLGVMVREGKFREDLFYRLNVIAVHIPSLRERREDLPVLAAHFLKKYGIRLGKSLEFSPEALGLLGRYDWPGNVRELENIIERTVILSVGPTIEPEDLNLNIEESLRFEKVDLNKIAAGQSVRSHIRDQEIQNLTDILIKTRGNVTEAARILDIPRTTLFNRLKKYKLL